LKNKIKIPQKNYFEGFFISCPKPLLFFITPMRTQKVSLGKDEAELFYINEFNKRKGTTRRVSITPHNVKTLCPVCNCQFGVDLADVFADQGDNDLMTTRVLCCDCAKATLERLGANVTAETLGNLIVKTKTNNFERSYAL
jgi:hypothetical protein